MSTLSRMKAFTAITAFRDNENGGFASTYSSPGWKRAQANRARAAAEASAHPDRGRGEAGRDRRSGAAKYEIGERVFHQKFGYGRIVAVEGNKLLVDFDKAGEKRVMDQLRREGVTRPQPRFDYPATGLSEWISRLLAGRLTLKQSRPADGFANFHDCSACTKGLLEENERQLRCYGCAMDGHGSLNCIAMRLMASARRIQAQDVPRRRLVNRLQRNAIRCLRSQ